VCGQENDSVRTMIYLPFRAPLAGTGWCCGMCRTDYDGAIAVLCDECLERKDPIAQLRWVVCGPIHSLERIAIEDAPRERIEHDVEQHAEFAREMQAVLQSVAMELNATRPIGFSPN
jgi:hypothetical protein